MGGRVWSGTTTGLGGRLAAVGNAVRAYLTSSWWARILAIHDTEPTELLLAVLMLTAGAQLCRPGQTFTATNAGADLLIVPEVVWGAALLIVGVWNLFALRDGSRSWRWWASMVDLFLWSALAGALLHAIGVSLLGALCLPLAGATCWVSLRLGERR